MTSFRFSLQKALEWRRTQLEMEEVRFKRQLAALAALDRERDELRTEGNDAECQVRAWKPVAGSDLAALDRYRRHLKERDQAIGERRVSCETELAERQRSMLEARRRCRLLERLKDRRYAEWVAARDRELEEVASESYLARWNRERSSL